MSLLTRVDAPLLISIVSVVGWYTAYILAVFERSWERGGGGGELDEF
jgi:hypothetical protein